MSLTLYNFSSSTCSQAVRFCLAEKGLDWEDHRMKSPSGEHLREPYISMNPNGVVPTLVHDGVPITDSSAIMEYIDDVWPEPSMVPADPKDRAKMRAWLRFFEEFPHGSIRYPSFHYFIGKTIADRTPEQIKAFADKHPSRKEFYGAMQADGFAEKELAVAKERLVKALDRVEKTLSNPYHKGPWIMGQQLTVADACLLPVIDRMNDLRMADLWENGARPGVAAWYEAIQQRPAFASTFYEGTRLSENYGAPRNM